jgi:hypothetical protein
MNWWIPVALFIAILLYVVFKDSTNQLQYIAPLRIYWILRDNGTEYMPYVCKAFMLQTAPPWWKGKGIQFRIKNRTLQVGVLLRKGKPSALSDIDDDELEGLLGQLGGHEMDADARTIRDWD